MNMKYDSAVMERLVNATEMRAVDAYNAFSRVKSSIYSVNSYEWNDEKKREIDLIVQEIDDRLMFSINQIQSYLDYLKKKMSEFENRG